MKKTLFNSIFIKAITIIGLALLLLIPTSYISNLVDERAFRRAEVINEVSEKWGRRQTVAGPILSVPFLVYRKNSTGAIMEKHRYYAHFTPEEVSITGDIDHELRHRSIYEVILYRSNLQVKGTFKPLSFEQTQTHPDEVLWEEAFISVGMSDLTGLEKKVQLTWDDTSQPFEAGLPNRDVLRTGIHSKVLPSTTEPMKFSFDIHLKGSERLAFVPIGQSTNVSLSSEWPDPSFDGDFIATKREVTEDGFDANWQVLDLNRNLPNQWTGDNHNIYEKSFGVTMLIPVNEYQKNSRSSKYALLIIALTFLTFFLSEIINKNSLHAFHYVLAGLGLVIFYILLLSFSEHVGFDLAYLLSSLMTILCIVFYISAVIKNKVFTGVLTSFFALVYTFIYVILQLQDYSLLVGAIGLFIALAVTMYLTRNIDWNALGKKPEENEMVVG